MAENCVTIDHAGQLIGFECAQQAPLLAVATASFYGSGREVAALSTGPRGALQRVFVLVSAALCREGREGLSEQERAAVLARVVGQDGT
jgi:hypothetical protein